MSEYREEQWLMLSGIQHFCFCPRQWALIHIEQQWQDNLRTVEGELLHKKAHDTRLTEKRGDMLITRGMPVHSAALGVSGACDVVEFYQSEQGVPLAKHRGKWKPVPVEYNRGSSKSNNADRLQICCQAICLEEMLATPIEKGYLFYWESRRREEVLFSSDLRKQVEQMLKQMHDYFQKSYTPKVKPTKSCNACSLRDICLPKLCGKLSVHEYISACINEINMGE